MRPRLVLAAGLGLGLGLGLVACATMRQVAALRQVQFGLDRVTGIRLAGVSLDHVRRPQDLNAIDYARITTALLRNQVPLQLDLHVAGDNPIENNTTARLTRLQWTLLLNNRETVSGSLDTSYTFPPGIRTDVRVPVSLELTQFFQGSASDLLDLALGLAGLGTRQTDVELRAIPSIDTPLGPIRYPNAVSIRRTVNPQ